MFEKQILPIIIAIFASGGFWAFLTAIVNKISDRKSAQSRMLKGLGHDRIISLCERYIARGWISSDEFENLHDYLYVPYREMGGNGTAEKLMKEVMKLPAKKPAPTPRASKKPAGQPA